MKQLSFILILLSLLATGCSKHETIITGQILGETGIYQALVFSESSFTGFNDTVQTDDKGFFEIKLTIENPLFVTLWATQPYKQVKLLIEPGENYHCVFDGEKEVQITGTYEKGQMSYASLPNPGFGQMSIMSFRTDTSVTQIHEKIEKQKH